MSINWARLSEHFPVEDVEFKPQTMSKDGTKALAIAFVDPRAYQRRLDDAVGVANWSVEYRPLGERAIIARITITDIDTGLTVVREEVGEFDDKGLAQYPTASAQAFKRACVTLGLGRYLYDMPQTWVNVENRRITDSELNRLRSMVQKMAPKASPTPAPTPAPQKSAPASKAPASGAQALQQAKAIQRISQLIDEAKEKGIDFNLPVNWQTSSYDVMVKIGQQINAELKAHDEHA
jgi:hypothetical protein